MFGCVRSSRIVFLGSVKSTVDDKRNSGCKKSVDRSKLRTGFISVNHYLVSPEIVLENKEIRANILRALYNFGMQRPSEWFQTAYLVTEIPSVELNMLMANVYYLFRSGLIESPAHSGREVPTHVRITPRGIDVVENPVKAKDYEINLQLLQIGTNLGQVAQANHGSSVTQTQFSNFTDLKRLTRERNDLSDEVKNTITEVLDGLDKETQAGTLTKKTIDKAMETLSKYSWLIPPLTEVLKHALGFH